MTQDDVYAGDTGYAQRRGLYPDPANAEAEIYYLLFYLYYASTELQIESTVKISQIRRLEEGKWKLKMLVVSLN